MRLACSLSILFLISCGGVVNDDAPDASGNGDANTAALSFTVDQSALLVVPGQTGEFAITITSAPADSAVQFSVAGAPAGVTIDPVNTDPGETAATITVSADAGANPAEAELTVTATSSGEVATETARVAVSGPSGTLDLDFAANGIFRSVIDTQGRAIARAGDGYVVAGTNNGQVTAIRLLGDGSADSSFAGGMAVTALANGGQGRGVAVDSDGNVIVAGASFDAGGNPQMTLFRFTSAGALDTTFGNGGLSIYNVGGVRGSLVSVHVESSGDLLAADEDGLIIRFSAGGNVNNALGVATPSTDNILGGTLLESDGGLVTVARTANGNIVTGRRTPDDFDTTFTEAVSVLTMSPTGIVKVPGGYVAGGIGSAVVDLIRILDDGSTDANFGNGGALAGAAVAVTPGGVRNNMAVDADGRVLFGAKQRVTNGNIIVVRFLADGSVDAQFPGSLTTDQGSGSVAGMVFDDFGRIVAVGEADGQLVVGRLWP